MDAAEIRTGFEAALAARGLTLEGLDAATAIAAVTDFYVNQRLDDVDPGEDGDGLLFQWGTYDWGDGPTFQYDLTRQTISTGPAGDDDDDDDDDGGIWQLSLVLHFAPSVETAALGEGDRWCWNPDHVPELLEFIDSVPCTQFARTHTPLRVELDHDSAG